MCRVDSQRRIDSQLMIDSLHLWESERTQPYCGCTFFNEFILLASWNDDFSFIVLDYDSVLESYKCYSAAPVSSLHN